MKPWWEEWPGRLEAEIARFRDLGFSFVVDESERASKRIVLVGRYRLNSGREIPLKIVYPDTFPNTRFTVFATDTADRVRAHQNPLGGNLCLLPRGSRAWRPSMLAADVIADRIDLIYDATGVPRDLEDRQGEPITGYLPYIAKGGILVTEECFDLPTNITHGRLRVTLDRKDWLLSVFRGERAGPTGRALLSEVLDPSMSVVSTADPSVRSLFRDEPVTGIWARLNERPDPRNIEALQRVVSGLAQKIEFRRRTQVGEFRVLVAALLLPEEAQYGIEMPNWVFQIVAQRQKDKPEGFAWARSLRYGVEARTHRIPELRAVRDSTVSVIGLGSLGAPLVMQLVRGGVREIRVADHDYVDPAGGVRWVSELEGAGALKTDVLTEMIARNYRNTRVVPHHILVGDTPLRREGGAEREAVEGWAHGAYLLIDATAEDDVSRVVAATGTAAGIPQVYLWSVDAYGGVVARVLPGRTGCWYCLSLHLSVEHGTITKRPYANHSDERRTQPVGCSDPTFTGDAASLMPLADHAARVVYGLLCDGQKDGYPSYKDDIFVLRLREPDGTLITPEWTSYRLTVHPRCPHCNPVSSSATPS